MISVIGWLGTSLIVFAFFLVSRGSVEPKGYTFHLLNMCGAVCLGIDTGWNMVWSAFGLQIIWFAISLQAIRKIK